MKKSIYFIMLVLGAIPALVGFFIRTISSAFTDGCKLHDDLYKWVTGKEIE